MRQIKFWFVFLPLVLCLAVSLADPLVLDEDLTGTIRIQYDESNPDAGAYVYTYRYPHIADSDPDGASVNLFYGNLLEDLETNLQFTAEGYASVGKSVNVSVEYKVTCNNSRYFSLLCRRTVTSEDETRIIWQGHTFARGSSASDGTCDLTVLLGLPDIGGQSEERQARQTEKVSQAVRRLVLKQMEENPDNIEWLEDFTADDLTYTFYPVEDFYLDKRGNPVFYLEPGIVADESLGYIRFSVSLVDIEDEL